MHPYMRNKPPPSPPQKKEVEEVGKEEASSYNEKRHCKNNIVASVGSHIYPLRCFQRKQSPFINEDFAVNLEAPPET